ncbi:hypothetical protein HIM_00229 [Hirsutella minnesotensis 3608]|nr:hypothetical protein HIM_00229 [Hirsutella minnesotensis 3608]
MSKQDAADQVKFLVACIRNTSNGKPDFAAVAEQLGIVSKAAAQKRYERMLKANGVGSSPVKKAVGEAAADGDNTPTPQSTPVKRKAPRRATPAKAKKSKEFVDGEDDSEPEAKKKPKKAVKKEVKGEASDSELTGKIPRVARASYTAFNDSLFLIDPPVSEDTDEI